VESFTISSDLGIPAATLLRSLSMKEVNRELWPLARMTAPARWRSRPIRDWPEGERLFRSWILLLGLLPVDRHVFQLRRIAPDEGFTEQSSSLANAVWRHRRRILQSGSGCRITDTVEYRSRLPLAGRLLNPVYRMVFRHRHRRLRRLYGTPAGESPGH
jgi:hypothetical protein